MTIVMAIVTFKYDILSQSSVCLAIAQITIQKGLVAKTGSTDNRVGHGNFLIVALPVVRHTKQTKQVFESCRMLL